MLGPNQTSKTSSLHLETWGAGGEMFRELSFWHREDL
jgi:hypothetical protein